MQLRAQVGTILGRCVDEIKLIALQRQLEAMVGPSIVAVFDIFSSTFQFQSCIVNELDMPKRLCMAPMTL